MRFLFIACSISGRSAFLAKREEADRTARCMGSALFLQEISHDRHDRVLAGFNTICVGNDLPIGICLLADSDSDAECISL